MSGTVRQWQDVSVIAADPEVRASISEAVGPEVRVGESIPFPGLEREAGRDRVMVMCPRSEEEFGRCARLSRETGGEAIVIVLPRHAEPETGVAPEDVVARGGSAIGLRDLLARVARGLARGGGPGAMLDRERRRLASLTDRELEVLTLTAEGLSVNEIAKCLHRSINTVATHRRNLHRKLGLDDRVALTRFAIRHGVTTAG